MDNPFADLPVIGRMPTPEAAERLRAAGELDLALELEGEGEFESTQAHSPSFGLFDNLFGGTPRPWQNTAHTFGYLAPGGHPSGGTVAIENATNIDADLTLRGAAIKITLDDMRVAAYPGGGIHRVLFDFGAQNQLKDKAEELHFNATFRVQDGQQAGFLGQPIFTGLNVGDEGLTLRCFTVNVKNDNDQKFLDTLETDVFKSGLRLLNAAQPAIAPLSSMAVGVTRALASRNQNIPVQDVILGLDFGKIRTRAGLAEGSYIAVQIPDSNQVTWDWSAWVYNTSSGRIVSKADPTLPIPYNYFVFSISRMTSSPAPPAAT